MKGSTTMTERSRSFDEDCTDCDVSLPVHLLGRSRELGWPVLAVTMPVELAGIDGVTNVRRRRPAWPTAG